MTHGENQVQVQANRPPNDPSAQNRTLTTALCVLGNNCHPPLRQSLPKFAPLSHFLFMAKKSTPPATAATPAAQSATRSFDWTPWALAAIAFGLFATGFGHPLVEMDDHSATVDNPAVTNFSIFSNFNLGMYAPLTWLFYAIGYRLQGADPLSDSATWYHVFGAVVHAVSTVLVYRLFERGGLGRWSAFFVALLFAIHPVQVESVAWVAGFSTPLYGMFVLFSLFFYQKYVQTSLQNQAATYWYALALGMMILGCLAKSSAVITPLLLIVFDLWRRPHYPTPTRQVLAYAPFFGVALGFGLLTIYTRSQINVPFGILHGYEGWERFFLVCYAPLFYLQKIMAPLYLNVYYSFDKINGHLPGLYYVAPLALTGLGFLAWRYRRTMPFWGIGLLFFMANHLVTLPFAPVGSFELCADHYNYLACLGVFFALVAWYDFLKKNNSSWAAPLRVAGIVWVLALSLLSIRQITLWENAIKLVDNAIANGYLNNGKMYFWRASGYAKRAKAGDLKRALDDYTKAIQMDSTLVEAYKYRGALYGVAKQYDRSVEDLTKYLATNPPEATEYRFNRGLSYLNLKRMNEAMTDLNQTLKENPDFTRAYRTRGNAYLQLGDTLRGQADLAEYERRMAQEEQNAATPR
jgi:protein O-mannosyl-transferase